jgi:NADH-quinone oxidoreductase subunit K
MIVPLEHILILASLLFFIGMGGLLAWRANLIMMLVSIEVMLNAVMLVFVAGSARWGNAEGQYFSIFIMALTSAEVSLALAMVVYLHRRRKTVDTDMFCEMKG